MARPKAIGYLRRDVSRSRQSWDEAEIRSTAQRFGYNLTKTVVFSEHTDSPEARLQTVVSRLDVTAVFTPGVNHFVGATVPRGLVAVANVITTSDQHTYPRTGQAW